LNPWCHLVRKIHLPLNHPPKPRLVQTKNIAVAVAAVDATAAKLLPRQLLGRPALPRAQRLARVPLNPFLNPRKYFRHAP
jgi:hypothetical protein